MASKLVTDREKSARAVSAAAQTHAPDIAAAVVKELSPFLRSGESMPDIALVIRLVGRAIVGRAEALVKADIAHENELADDAEPRERRDEAARNVRTSLVDLRIAIDAAYGPLGLTKLGLDGAVPEDPSVIANKAKSVHRALLDDSLKLPKPRRASMKVDRKGFAEEIAADLPSLEKALAKVAEEQRELEATQQAKWSQMAAYDRTFSRGAGWIAATAALGGLEEIAARVKPSGRNPGRTAKEVEGNGAAGEAEEGSEGG